MRMKWNSNAPNAARTIWEKDSTPAKTAEHFSIWMGNCGNVNSALKQKPISKTNVDAPIAVKYWKMKATASAAVGQTIRDGLENTTDNIISKKIHNMIIWITKT